VAEEGYSQQRIKSVKRYEQMKKEVESSIITGRIKLDNPNFSLLYSVKRDSPSEFKVLLKLFNEIEQKPVTKMTGIILNEQEVDLLIDVLQKLKNRMMDNVQS
jgi:hypothetical protein